MPIYEYICTKCKNKFEMLRSLKDANNPVTCPTCGGKAQKILSNCATFSKNEGGFTRAIARGSNSCSGCSSNSCSGCS